MIMMLPTSMQGSAFVLRGWPCVSLAKATGCRDEARSMFAGIYGWFTAGFDLSALKEAKALLEELGRV